MTFHIGGFYESLDQGNVASLVAAIPDQSLTVQGDDLQIPNEVSMLAGAAVLTAATTFTSAQFQSPSLRTLANFDVNPYIAAQASAGDPRIAWLGANPYPLAPGEQLNLETNTDNAAATPIRGYIWLSDGPMAPIDGQIFTTRVTSAITLANGVWTNGNLTFTEELPSGDYRVVGMRSTGTGLAAARLVFKGAAFRPGVLGITAQGGLDFDLFRYGRLGEWGVFNNNTPPSVDCDGATGTSQTHFLDLIKVG